MRKTTQEIVQRTCGRVTIAVKMLADTAKQLASVYAGQQAQIVKLAKRVEELETAKGN
jgi:cytochrome c551/c552